MVELTGKTLPQVFRAQAEQRKDEIALREKEFGIWQPVTWRQYLEHVRHFSLGLRQLGFSRGDHLAILSENCREWLYAGLGSMSLGGVMLGVYPTSPYPEVHYVVKHSDAVVVVCEDQEQTDKILQVVDDLPKLKKIIVTDMKGLRNYSREKIISFAQVEALGRDLAQKEPGRFDEEIRSGRPEDVCIMVYTSGTTGPPKGAMVSHGNVEAMTRSAALAMEIDAGDSVVSYRCATWPNRFSASICRFTMGSRSISPRASPPFKATCAKSPLPFFWAYPASGRSCRIPSW